MDRVIDKTRASKMHIINIFGFVLPWWKKSHSSIHIYQILDLHKSYVKNYQTWYEIVGV